MDAVNAFNVELFSMIDMKPPISRAKMMSITKSAIKAIKLYKHVVQIVEKFIKKCKPELKVPGLYVVDSIVRQSRHQFGMDKDVFGPRFLKNFTTTFQNLYMCPLDDKSKILRVLNLWQKNGVFTMDIIQPLLDMATTNVMMPVVENGLPAAASPAPAVPAETPLPVTSASIVQALPQLQNSGALAAVAQLFQSSQGQELQHILQTLQQPQASVMEGSAGAAAAGPPMASAQPVPHSLPPTEQKSSSVMPVPGHILPSTEQKNSFAKKLLDRFDYDDEPEPAEEVKEDLASAMPPNVQPSMQQPIMYPPFPAQMPSQPGLVQMQGMGQPMMAPQMSGVPFMAQMQASGSSASQQPQMAAMEADPSGRRDRKDDARDRRSRSRSPRRHSPSRSRRSRSGSRPRRSRFHRSRSRSRERRPRDWRSPRSRSEERRERERERERRQKGLPPLKSKTLSVCSTTLWVGQLDKKTTQQDISLLLEEFGQIESINMIPPRGCAYIVMVHRQDAYRALTSLSRGTTKVNQKAIKIAWALNKGIKPDLKKLWDVERGVTYIPWEKVKVDDLESYREGGMLDAETLCPDWNSSVKELTKPAGAAAAVSGVQEGRRTEEQPVSTAQVPPSQAVPAPSAGKPGFPPPMGLPPPAMMPGGPPPPFLPPAFDPTQIPPGFPPPGALAAAGPTPTGPSMNMPPMSAPGKSVEEPPKDKKVPENAPSEAPGGQSMSPPPAGGLLGARPGMMPLQRPPPPGPLPPFMPHFPPDMPPPNMPPMPPPMMPRGPNPMMFREHPPGRFRMPMPHPHPHPPRDDFLPPPEDFPPPMDDFVPPHGPPHMRPEGMDDWDGPPPPPFAGDWHRETGWFRDQPPHRGRGGRGWGRDRPGPGGPGRFMNRHEGFD
ncbi:hypothetical protein ACEWY4_008721 [Coilia grayii]|uniref:Uncharacterized protein n=1 Tax=Coilia grayii TaxID=363190 RepID=A0ABD1KCJ2_9TELE